MTYFKQYLESIRTVNREDEEYIIVANKIMNELEEYGRTEFGSPIEISHLYKDKIVLSVTTKENITLETILTRKKIEEALNKSNRNRVTIEIRWFNDLDRDDHIIDKITINRSTLERFINA